MEFNDTSVATNSTNQSAFVDDSSSMNIRMVKFYSLIIVIIIGIISNTLSLVVLSNSHIKKTSTGVYLIFLSVADITALTGEFINWLHEGGNGAPLLGIDLMHTSDVFCRLFVYIRYFGRIWSCWLIVIITVERYLSIAHPLWVTTVSKTKRALIICLVEVALAAAACSTTFFSLQTKLTGEPQWLKCAVIRERYRYLVLYPIIIVGEMTLPSIIVFFFTVLILGHLYKASELRRVISITQPNSNSTQLTSTLLGLALTFVFIRLPYIITYLIRRHFPDCLLTQAVLDTSYVLSVANYAINFFLYCLCGSVFRGELRRVICSRCAPRKTSAMYIMDLYSSPGSRHRLSREHYNCTGTVMADV